MGIPGQCHFPFIMPVGVSTFRQFMVREADAVPLQADGEVLPEVLAWFRDISDTDRDAALIFPPSLSKNQRAAIHTLVQTVGLGALASVSKGLGESRHLTVVRAGQGESTSQVSRPHLACTHRPCRAVPWYSECCA